MLIGLCGGICAGKHSVAATLVDHHGFQRISLTRTISTPAVEKTASDARLPESNLNEPTQIFANIDMLSDFVTKRWQERWVTTDIWDEEVLEVLLRKPFFLLVSVDAPVSVRWRRFKRRCDDHALEPPSLEQFVLRNDDHLYNSKTGLAKLIERAQVRLLNSTSSIETLQDALKALDLTDEKRLRPTWDQYFMRLASLAAQRSNCMKRRVGCVLVREKRVISTGYNGTPRNLTNCNEGGCKDVSLDSFEQR
ncbi:MAG: Deoxycytidine monophosphate (dCMP) deaminase [Bogoriella megaspora]|nr:MAG: Deoxycytidine monophosphate (dCMP) deaminase [Bogoriella megaspora]